MTTEHPEVPSTDTLYCHRDADGGYDHFYSSAVAVTMCSVAADEVVRVRLVPDDEGTHWCWHDYENDEYSMVWPSFVQLDMCFTYGIEVEEKKNRGLRTRVRVEEVAA